MDSLGSFQDLHQDKAELIGSDTQEQLAAVTDWANLLAKEQGLSDSSPVDPLVDNGRVVS